MQLVVLVLALAELPAEVVKRYSGIGMAVVGYEVDQIPDLMNLAPPDKVSYARYL